jgi:hypothetical protein
MRKAPLWILALSVLSACDAVPAGHSIVDPRPPADASTDRIEKGTVILVTFPMGNIEFAGTRFVVTEESEFLPQSYCQSFGGSYYYTRWSQLDGIPGDGGQPNHTGTYSALALPRGTQIELVRPYGAYCAGSEVVWEAVVTNGP